jgi:Kdo2-lipid IVA lauroyltransferase/acyltransferase
MYYLVYSLLYLLSVLPLRLLYVLSDGFYGVVYHVIGYRKKVVLSNLKIAFPEKTDQERIRIAKKFYHNLIDSFIEMVKLISTGEEFLRKRFVVENTESLNELHKTGKSCHMHLGHTFNWEWGHLVLATLTPYQVIVVYMPISNPVFEKLIYRIRTRSGNVFLPANQMRRSIEPWLSRQYLLGLVADQNPGNPATAYWHNFFGRPTSFVSGPEKSARVQSLPVVFAYITKPKRGQYRAVVSLATQNAAELKEGELTHIYVKYLEGVIRDNPEMWLWSHRRWKHEWKEEYRERWVDKIEPMIPEGS